MRDNRKSKYVRKADLKIDSSINGDAEELVKKHLEVERNLHPLRINSYTTIYVKKEKCNKGYAEEYAEMHGLNCKIRNG